jgi:molybdenum cofactor sulfurtransferase
VLLCRILSFFNTDSSKYTVIFTSGATGSLKTVAENFNFNGPSDSSGSFVYLQDIHTSVLGMREVVNTSKIVNIKREDLLSIEKVRSVELNENHHNSLVVFPAQCNFNGFKYPLDLIEKVQSAGILAEGKPQPSNWYVCLDAASYVASNFLDLTKYQPDYVCISFYKIFG